MHDLAWRTVFPAKHDGIRRVGVEADFGVPAPRTVEGTHPARAVGPKEKAATEI